MKRHRAEMVHEAARLTSELTDRVKIRAGRSGRSLATFLAATLRGRRAMRADAPRIFMHMSAGGR